MIILFLFGSYDLSTHILYDCFTCPENSHVLPMAKLLNLSGVWTCEVLQKTNTGGFIRNLIKLYPFAPNRRALWKLNIGTMALIRQDLCFMRPVLLREFLQVFTLMIDKESNSLIPLTESILFWLWTLLYMNGRVKPRNPTGSYEFFVYNSFSHVVLVKVWMIHTLFWPISFWYSISWALRKSDSKKKVVEWNHLWYAIKRFILQYRL